MARDTLMTSQDLAYIAHLTPEEVTAFISSRQRDKALAPLIKQLNDTLLNGQADQRDGARRALEKLGFTDI